ncbi:SNF2 family N-terminal domain-containing protein [Piptocephalis cylindrospora]|uniref:SNF2 family N-terminal domain-containing protein n=1 Tax=Piptocephalis cylindrospora TaxID=1907219 RepID=A0A4P9YAD1_9FUNG|nr:SNF2 family N-terminal domain-containing protein [Piptocephalis cylindrospora]|eukprot:RKP15030.1 SNF2 family N-terminal domain-containing protein [Piptocephalis cylindrospora]
MTRRTAAKQLGELQRKRPEDLGTLLARILPYLGSSSWETRTAAGFALEEVVGAVPTYQPSSLDVKGIKEEGDSHPLEISPSPSTGDLLSFQTIDIREVLDHGKPLLASVGKEFDVNWAEMTSSERLAMQRKNLQKTLGVSGQFMDGLVDEKDLSTAGSTGASSSSNPSSRSSPSSPSAMFSMGQELSAEKEEVEEDFSHLSKRELNALKRKRKLHGKSRSKMRALEGTREEAAKRTGAGGEAGQGGEKMSSEEKKLAQIQEATSLTSERQWPFAALCDRLLLGIFSPSWEDRHGFGLGLRALFKKHAETMGLRDDLSPEANDQAHVRAMEDAALRLLCLLVLDRFGDYVSDQVITPTREVGAQALGALIHQASPEMADRVFVQIIWLIQQHSRGQGAPNNSASSTTAPSPIPPVVWQVRHAGLLALKYIVAVRSDCVLKWAEMGLLDAVMIGLEDRMDDVKAIAASVLLPILHICIEAPSSVVKLGGIARVLWDSLREARDDLASSVGDAMELLSKVMSYPQVLSEWREISVRDQGTTLGDLFPVLFPFFRHPVTNVRIAVLQCVMTFLNTMDVAVDERLYRLLYQNILLETDEQVSKLSIQAWEQLIHGLSKPMSALKSFLPSWLSLTTLPIGYPFPLDHLYRSDLTEGRAGGSQWHDIDKAMIYQDISLIGRDQIMKNRIFASQAFGQLMVAWPLQDWEETFSSLITQCLNHPLALHQELIAIILDTYLSSAKTKDIKVEAIPSSIVTWTAQIIKAVDGADKSESVAWHGGMGAEAYHELFPLKQQASYLAHEALRTYHEDTGKTLESLQEAVQRMLTQAGHLTLAQMQQWVKQMDEAIASMKRPGRSLKDTKEAVKKLRTFVEQTYTTQMENLEGGVHAAFAGVIVNSGSLPSKTGPLIRALMVSIKTERMELLQERSARSLAALMRTSNKAQANGKLIKNLCSFLCANPKIVPIHQGDKEDAAYELTRVLQVDLGTDASQSKGAAKASMPTINAEEAAEKEAGMSILTRGAQHALHAISYAYGPELLEALSPLHERIVSPMQHVTSGAMNMSEASSGQIQEIVDALFLIEFLISPLDSKPRQTLLALLPDLLRYFIPCSLAIIRYMTGRAVVACAMVSLAPTLKVVVEEIIPTLTNVSSVYQRRGAISLLYVLIEKLDLRILPYAMFMMMPVLQRMSDMDEVVRPIANLAFAQLLRLIPLEAGIEDPEGFSLEQVKQREEERRFMEQLVGTSKVETFSIPIQVNATLRSYQVEGVSWLAFLNRYSLHGILCDDMGLGKTLQTICMVASDHHKRFIIRKERPGDPKGRHLPSLIICPPTLTGHWEQELGTYVNGLRVLVYAGPPSVRAALAKNVGEYDVIVASYEIIRNDIDRLGGMKRAWNYCVLDEGHIIKNARTKTTLAVKQIQAEHRLILSGTPIQNNVIELYSLFDFLMPGFLGTEKQFHLKYGRPISQSRDAKSSSKDQEAGAMALEALHRQVLPFLLRRMKEDVLDDLPPKIIQDYYCDLSGIQRKLYEEFSKSQAAHQVKQEIQHGKGGEDKGKNQGQAMHIFQALQYLRKVCSHPLLAAIPGHPGYEEVMKGRGSLEGAPKLQALRQLLLDCGIGVGRVNSDGSEAGSDLEGESFSSHRVLIFCQLRSMLDLIQEELFAQHMPSVTYLRLDGAVEARQRHSIVQTFNADPSIDVLLLTTSVGGLGLNLTSADTVIFVEHDWNPMKDLQAMDRAHRLGQKRVVNVYRLITRGTLEEKIMGLQKFKLNVANSVVNQQNASLESMNTNQLVDLFSVSTTQEPGKNRAVDEAGMEDDSTAGLGGAAKGVIEDLEALWEDDQYAEEFNLDSYVESLKRG